MYNTDLPKRADLPTTGKLLRSTALAALIAGGLLVTTVLPAEYGIDPTGIGRALGLTPMGEIKMSLAAEARAEERVATETAPAQPVAVAPTVRAEAAPVPAPAPVAVAALPPAAAMRMPRSVDCACNPKRRNAGISLTGGRRGRVLHARVACQCAISRMSV